MSSVSSARPPISVTASTVEGWTAIRDELTTGLESLRRVGGALIAIPWLCYAQAGGHLMGDVLGPGESPGRLQ